MHEVVPFHAPPQLTTTWAMDFVGDSLYIGYSHRLHNVLDEGHRELLAIEVDVSLPSARMVAVVEVLVAQYGPPQPLRCQNASKFISDAMRTWCQTGGVPLSYIEPGERNHSASIEHFSRSSRKEVLDAWGFASLTEVRVAREEWRHVYNSQKANESLGNVTPLSFTPTPTNVTPTNFKLCT